MTIASAIVFPSLVFLVRIRIEDRDFDAAAACSRADSESVAALLLKHGCAKAHAA